MPVALRSVKVLSRDWAYADARVSLRYPTFLGNAADCCGGDRDRTFRFVAGSNFSNGYKPYSANSDPADPICRPDRRPIWLESCCYDDDPSGLVVRHHEAFFNT